MMMINHPKPNLNPNCATINDETWCAALFR